MSKPGLHQTIFPTWLRPSLHRIVRVGLAITLFWVIEWLFHYTRPSWLRYSGLLQAAHIGTRVLWIGVVLGCTAQTMLEGLLLVARRVLSPIWPFLRPIAYVPEALILTVTGILFIDNILYTFTKIGVTTLPVEVIPWYRVSVGLAVIGWWFYAAYSDLTEAVRLKNIRIWALTAIMGIGTIPALIPGAFEPEPDTGLPSGTVAKTMPNILIISIDGVESQFMSVYGYDKETTPFLKRLASRSTVFHHHYTNNCCTLGSLVSMWTGQTPLEHGVVYPPATLAPERATQHLPGILRQLGYTTHQIGDEFYANGFKAGLRQGFDTVNFQTAAGMFDGKNPYNWWPDRFSETETMFINQVKMRVVRRLRAVKDPLVAAFTTTSAPPSDKDPAAVYEPLSTSMDATTLSQVAALIEKTKAPWFVHVHLLGTHGSPCFSPANEAFTKGMIYRQKCDLPFYLGALLDSDHAIARLWGRFHDQLDNALVIITSDHDRSWQTGLPMPLIIHTPGQVQSTNITRYLTQPSDLAPTILDYLGVPIPQRMSGHSILKAPPEPVTVYSVKSFSQICDDRGCMIADGWSSPPYGITSLSVRRCQELMDFTIDVVNKTLGTQSWITDANLPMGHCAKVSTDHNFLKSIREKLALKAQMPGTM